MEELDEAEIVKMMRLYSDPWHRLPLRQLAVLHLRLDRLEAALDEESRRMRRADGGVICNVCGKPYRMHPFTKHRDWNDDPYLNKLCNGDIVKL